MPLTRTLPDAFGAATAFLVLSLLLVGILCIAYTLRSRSLVPDYFNGPSSTRIAFVLVASLWGLGEISRSRLLRRRLSISPAWQENICKIYIVCNIGVLESVLLLIFVFLLRASLQKRESGVLNPRWNRKTGLYVFVSVLVPFAVQLVLVLSGPKEESKHEKLAKYFTTISALSAEEEDNDNNNNSVVTCLYPLVNTLALALFDFVLISYVSYVGFRMLRVVINKGLRRRICVLIISAVLSLLLRVALLGFSAIAQQGGVGHEVLVFLAFLVLLVYILLSICLLVYCPIADSLALRGLRRSEIEEFTPFDDYFDGASSLVVNQSQFELETGRNSDASTKRGSISFRTMIRDDPQLLLPNSDGAYEGNFFSSPGVGTFHVSSSPGSPFLQARTLVPLRGVPEC